MYTKTYAKKVNSVKAVGGMPGHYGINLRHYCAAEVMYSSRKYPFYCMCSLRLLYIMYYYFSVQDDRSLGDQRNKSNKANHLQK